MREPVLVIGCRQVLLLAFYLFGMELTYFLAQLIGLYCVIVGVVMLLRKKMFMEILSEFYRSPAALFLAGFIAMLLGLLMVLSHNYWSAGTLALVVTLVGWIALLKGLWIIFFPHSATRAIETLKVQEYSWAYAIVVLVVGLYLVHGGFSHMGLLH